MSSNNRSHWNFLGSNLDWNFKLVWKQYAICTNMSMENVCMLACIISSSFHTHTWNFACLSMVRILTWEPYERAFSLFWFVSHPNTFSREINGDLPYWQTVFSFFTLAANPREPVCRPQGQCTNHMQKVPGTWKPKSGTDFKQKWKHHPGLGKLKHVLVVEIKCFIILKALTSKGSI